LNQSAFDTRPDLMHCVQTRTRRTVPLSTVFTRCTLGFQTFLFLLLAWDTLFPKLGPLPQIAHFAMRSSEMKTKGKYHI
jgi:hypothetical protein